MFLAMKSRRRSGPSRGQLCAAAGCKCYCHEPSPKENPWMIVFAFVMIVVMYLAMIFLLSMDRPKSNIKCDGITSTGAPTNCHEVKP